MSEASQRDWFKRCIRAIIHLRLNEGLEVVALHSVTLEEVQELVDQLSAQDQQRLLDYLAPRFGASVHAEQSAHVALQLPDVDPWREFFRVGDSIAETAATEGETLTQAISTLRMSSFAKRRTPRRMGTPRYARSDDVTFSSLMVSRRTWRLRSK